MALFVVQFSVALIGKNDPLTYKVPVMAPSERDAKAVVSKHLEKIVSDLYWYNEGEFLENTDHVINKFEFGTVYRIQDGATSNSIQSDHGLYTSSSSINVFTAAGRECILGSLFEMRLKDDV